MDFTMICFLALSYAVGAFVGSRHYRKDARRYHKLRSKAHAVDAKTQEEVTLSNEDFDDAVDKGLI